MNYALLTWDGKGMGTYVARIMRGWGWVLLELVKDGGQMLWERGGHGVKICIPGGNGE